MDYGKSLVLRTVQEKYRALRPVTMETRFFHKKLEFQRFPPKHFCTARHERKSSKKKQTFQKPRKINSRADLGPRSA